MAGQLKLESLPLMGSAVRCPRLTIAAAGWTLQPLPGLPFGSARRSAAVCGLVNRTTHTGRAS